MAKYIDKSDLVAEIEKCYNECLKRAKISDLDYWNAKADAYRNVLVILSDTLEVKEETTSNEPLISSELLTASADYAREQLANPDYPTYNDEYELLCAFEAGANWQKEQAIEKTCKWLEDNVDHYAYNKDFVPNAKERFIKMFRRAEI